MKIYFTSLIMLICLNFVMSDNQTSFQYIEADDMIMYNGKEYFFNESNNLSGPEMITYIIISLGLVLFGGLMSGLTVGYLSIDELLLELKQNSGTDEEKRQSAKVMPLLHQHQWLLVTLFISNAGCNGSASYF